MTNTIEPQVNWTPDMMVEVLLNEPDDFLKVRETLTRIGVASRKEKKLYQSCHILHKQGRYYLVHFKELFALDGKHANLTVNDIQRRNRIAQLVADWGLVTIVDADQISDIAPLGVTATKEELSITDFVLSFQSNKSGAVKYRDPPETISSSPIVSKLSKLIIGEINASGVNVLSDGYSKPSFKILVWLIFPIPSDFAIKYAPRPSTESVPLKIGILLNPTPEEIVLILEIPPEAVLDFVVYFRDSHSEKS